MRFCVLFVLTTFSFVSLAQSNSPEIIASAGGVFSVDEQGSLSFTLGEIAVSSYTTNDQFLTEGFHQPIAMTTPTFHAADLEFEILAYPNPTGENINIMVNDLPETTKLEMEIIDILGKSHRNVFDVRNGNYEVNIGNLPGGIYFLQGKHLDQLVSTIKIQKL